MTRLSTLNEMAKTIGIFPCPHDIDRLGELEVFTWCLEHAAGKEIQQVVGKSHLFLNRLHICVLRFLSFILQANFFLSLILAMSVPYSSSWVAQISFPFLERTL